MAEAASAQLSFRDSAIGGPLEELWVAGDFLSTGDSVDDGVVLLRLAVPAAELPWLALHPKGEWTGQHLRLGKRPFAWWYRSLEDPPWNVEHRRVVRVWSASDGVATDVLENLRAGEGTNGVVEPTDADLAAQLHVDLERARQHLGVIVARYWDREWRQEHRPQPEDHLWRAAAAVCSLDEALSTLRG